MSALKQRITTYPSSPAPPDRFERVLGHPLAFLATAAILLALFGWTFIFNPERVAPTKDPAYYTWRTEMLISDDPVTLLETEGAFEMFAGGYRVSAPVIGGLVRRVAGVSSLNQTVLLMVALPVLTALLLASFAYRQRRDPLLWHAVAMMSASLFLTPPFVGYLDNMLCLLWLAAALPFLPHTRDSWPARAGFGMFLLLSGFTHPTTLAIFCLALGAMSIVRVLFRRFDVRSVVRDDGWMLVVALVAAISTYVIWKVGIWGRSASLSEAALPPPYGSDFFVDRMVLWIDAMRPALNLPLFVIGVAGLIMAGRKAAEDELARVSIVWLAPLAGIFGFLAGLTYPYYRFFNTTLAWVLLVGVGTYFVARLLIDVAKGGGIRVVALAGVVALGVIIASNFGTGFTKSGWNKAAGGWLSSEERRDLDALRATLGAEDDDRPVVFVIDDEPPAPFQIWGFAKLSGNTSRYGLPAGQIDRGYLYLGSLDNYLAGRPTTRGEETYDKLSPALLEDAQAGIEESGRDPVIVVASIFNPAGANTEMAARDEVPVAPEDVWLIREGEILGRSAHATSVPDKDAGAGHLVRVGLGLVLLLVPGLASRWFLPDVRFADGLAMVPAIALALTTLSGIVVLALVRSPFSPTISFITVALAILLGAALFRSASTR